MIGYEPDDSTAAGMLQQEVDQAIYANLNIANPADVREQFFYGSRTFDVHPIQLAGRQGPHDKVAVPAIER